MNVYHIHIITPKTTIFVRISLQGYFQNSGALNVDGAHSCLKHMVHTGLLF